MLISVITVSWNAAATIDATCASVDAQTHAEVEHLVIDGQSTDGTLDVLAARPSDQRQVVSEPDAGLYDAMNKGIQRARGEVIGFLNADDRYFDASVLAMVDRAFAQSGADAVYADIDMVIQAEPGRVQRRWRSGRHSPWKVMLGWHMPHPGLFIRASVMRAIGPFDTRFKIAADYDMMLRLMKHAGVRLHYLPVTAVEMAVGGISTSGLRASWRGYTESARAMGRHAGAAGYLIALAKPIWKLPQWLRGWRVGRDAPSSRMIGPVPAVSAAPAPATDDVTPRHDLFGALASLPHLVRTVRHGVDRLAEPPQPAHRARVHGPRVQLPGGGPQSASARSDEVPTGLQPLHVGKFVPPPFAGIESHVDTLLRAMSPMASATLVASESRVRSTVGREATPYRLIACPSYGTVSSVAMSPQLLGIVEREFRAGRANLLHVHAPNPWGDLAALDAPKDVPVVMSWHSDVVSKPVQFTLYRPIQTRALARVDRIVVPTPLHFERSTQLAIPGIEKRLVVIPYGIDFEALDATPSNDAFHEEMARWTGGRPLVLSVGRHVPYKGYRHLIASVMRWRSDAVLLMIGTGPLSRSLHRQVASLQLGERVRLIGEADRSTMVTAVRACDVFCLPSIERSEAFGIASAEAMSFGKPTVVCELGNGVNYLNRAGDTSLAVPPCDEAALADAIDQLANDTSLRLRFGAAARAWVRGNFTVDQMRDGTLALYRSLA